MKHQLFEEIEKFKTWSRQLNQTPEDERTGKWERAYEGWNAVDAAFIDFVNKSNPVDWTEEVAEALLYLIARDHASEIFADLVAAHPDKLQFLARQAVDANSPASKWQLVIRLPELGDPALAENLLLRFIDDPDAYVRRRTLQTLAIIGSDYTEHYCEVAWQSPGPQQRIAALEALFTINSPRLLDYLKKAHRDGNPDLVQYADEIEKKLNLRKE
ncbi:MAG: HEAT repeat domain-containing protein [Cytophagales bacterium]|nr:HEAT repeat domain-containing protein [Cytophagales bacterium]